MSFVFAYSSYNQIPMHKDDQKATTFIKIYGTYCYKVMTLGFKNASTTYQRLATSMFPEMIGEIIEVYINDMW